MSDSPSLSSGSQNRRQFLKSTGALTAALLTPAGVVADVTRKLPPLPGESSYGFGHANAEPGQDRLQSRHFLARRQASLERPHNFDVAVPIIDRALDLGVNYIDTSSIYGARIAGASSMWAR